MDSLQEIKRRIATSLLIILVIGVIGVIGFIIFEKLDLLNALWMTIITLTTIGYGDIVPVTPAGRLFNLSLILVGIGAYAYAFQAVAELISSPVIRDARSQRRARKEIAQLEDHYIICGEGLMIKHITAVMAQIDEIGQYRLQSAITQRLERWLALGGAGESRWRRHCQALLLRLGTLLARPFIWIGRRQLNRLVVITTDATIDPNLPGFIRVLKGSPTSDEILLAAGVERASAMMVTLDDDAQSLLVVLTARQYNSHMRITSTIRHEDMRSHVIRAGATSAILPYEIGGHILNMATLRPAVSDFFTYILFNLEDRIITEQYHISDTSPVIGQELGSLNLAARCQAGVIALMQPDGSFLITPPPEQTLQEDQVLLITSPLAHIPSLNRLLTGSGGQSRWQISWQRLPVRMEHPHQPLPADKVATLDTVQAAIDHLSQHFVICADGRAGQEAVQNLDPARPFVIIANDAAYADWLLSVGFRVVLGNPIHQEVLEQAGVKRALSLMVTQQDEATSLLTVLTARSLSKTLNITAAADNTLMETKLKRAGADRIAMPFQVAAEFIFLTVIRPVVIDFFQHVVFNRQQGIETTELYMQDDSPFIGNTIAETGLQAHYQGYTIGIRRPDGRFVFAPPPDYTLQPHEVLIVVAPMAHTDELRVIWRRHKTARLTSIRPKYHQARPARRRADS